MARTAPDDPDDLFGERLPLFKVAESGYRVETRRSRDELRASSHEHVEVIAPVWDLEGQQEGAYRRYSASDRPDLYLTFITLPASDREYRTAPRAFVEFANQWGLLGVPAMVHIIPSKGHSSLNSEGVTQWMEAVRNMRRAVRVWELVRDQDNAGLGTVFRYDAGRGTWGYRFEDGLGGYDSAGMVGPGTPEDLDAACRRWLAEEINRPLHRGFRLRYYWDDERERMASRFLPTNLLAAMWWCFAKEVTGQASYRPCRSCGKPMEISTDDTGRYRNTLFCSDACKQRDYRAKVRHAKEMNAKGQTLREIAKRFDTSTAVIKNWLSK